MRPQARTSSAMRGFQQPCKTRVLTRSQGRVVCRQAARVGPLSMVVKRGARDLASSSKREPPPHEHDTHSARSRPSEQQRPHQPSSRRAVARARAHTNTPTTHRALISFLPRSRSERRPRRHIVRGRERDTMEQQHPCGGELMLFFGEQEARGGAGCDDTVMESLDANLADFLSPFGGDDALRCCDIAGSTAPSCGASACVERRGRERGRDARACLRGVQHLPRLTPQRRPNRVRSSCT